MAQFAGFASKDSVNRIKRYFFKEYPNKAVKSNQEIIFALLDKDPTLSGTELATLTNCSISTACSIQRKYFEKHREAKEMVKQTIEQTKYKHIITKLLDENPALSSVELGQLANCPSSTAYQAKREYLKTHNQPLNLQKTKAIQKVIFDLLEQNPALTRSELTQLTGYSLNVTAYHKKMYLKVHQDTRRLLIEEQKKLQKTIFNLLNENPNLTGKELASKTNCTETTGCKYKKRWLKLQAEQGEPQDDASA